MLSLSKHRVGFFSSLLECASPSQVGMAALQQMSATQGRWWSASPGSCSHAFLHAGLHPQLPVLDRGAYASQPSASI